MASPFEYEERRDSITLLRASRFGGQALAAAGGLCGWRAPWFQPSSRSGVNLVEVYAAVTDEAGNPVTGLARADFTVLEDGQPQTLSAFAEGDFPLSVALGGRSQLQHGGEAAADRA